MEWVLSLTPVSCVAAQTLQNEAVCGGETLDTIGAGLNPPWLVEVGVRSQGHRHEQFQRFPRSSCDTF